MNQPLIAYWPEGLSPPEGYAPGTVNDQLIASIDLAAQTVSATGANVPEWMHGKPFLGSQAIERDFVYSAADWIGGSRIKIRSVRTKQYRYIRNYNTDISVRTGSSQYRIAMHPMYHLVEMLDDRGELSPLHKKLLIDTLPEEELYDIESDPDELENLINSPDYVAVANELRNTLENQIKETGDLGFDPLEEDHIQHFVDYRKKQIKQYKQRRTKMRQSIQQALAE